MKSKIVMAIGAAALAAGSAAVAQTTNDPAPMSTVGPGEDDDDGDEGKWGLLGLLGLAGLLGLKRRDDHDHERHDSSGARNR